MRIAGLAGRAAVRALPAVAVLVLTACGTSGAPDGAAAGTGTGGAGTVDGGELGGTLTVFAAASLTDVFQVLGDRLEAEHPALDVRFNFAGSSALAAQVLQGAPADVLASADEAQIARVVEAGLAAEADLFAANRLVVAVPSTDPAGIADRAGTGTAGVPGLGGLLPGDVVLAVCAPEVPCGAAAAQVLDRVGLGGAPDTYEEDVRGVLTKVVLGEVDAGLVYRTDVLSAGDAVLAFEFREAGAAANRYPVAVLDDAPNPAAAAAFTDLLLSGEGRRVLQDAGFAEP